MFTGRHMSATNETARYAIQVTNELFHNVNVEAWKNIIESFESKHPDLKVNVFFDNKPIFNIHELNEWGKIRFGNAIYFSVSGERFRAISTLKKYLVEAAGKRASIYKKNDPAGLLQLEW